MAERAGRRWLDRVVGFGGVLCLGAVVVLQWDEWPAFLQAGYHARVEAEIQEGDIPGALALIDRASLLDEAALEVLNERPGQGLLALDRARDLALRIRIAEWFVGELGTGSSLDAEQEVWLESATDNAKLLVELDPAGAQSHLLLGLVYLQRGYASGIPIEFRRAVRHLRLALRIDPEIPRAAPALKLATARLRELMSATARDGVGAA